MKGGRGGGGGGGVKLSIPPPTKNLPSKIPVLLD